MIDCILFFMIFLLFSTRKLKGDKLAVIQKSLNRQFSDFEHQV